MNTLIHFQMILGAPSFCVKHKEKGERGKDRDKETDTGEKQGPKEAEREQGIDKGPERKMSIERYSYIETNT